MCRYDSVELNKTYNIYIIEEQNVLTKIGKGKVVFKSTAIEFIENELAPMITLSFDEKPGGVDPKSIKFVDGKWLVSADMEVEHMEFQEV